MTTGALKILWRIENALVISDMEKQILRFTTAGSVDDGKSTLIGRLLYETNSIPEDQLSWLNEVSKQKGQSRIDFSLLTDGLRAEREQGITIDVAYRYFETPKRRFIIADTPGHLQYTRNMVTGASQASLALILVDARNGLVEQTFRHSYILSLLGIRQIILCVNKMDLVDYSQERFESVASAYIEFSKSLNFTQVECIPLVAINGDHVTTRSDAMPWYTGKCLLDSLENASVNWHEYQDNFRFPVQYVIRPQSNSYPDFRGYAGRIVSGHCQIGDEITILPAGLQARISEIRNGKDKISSAQAPMSVTLVLDHALDVGRGDLLTASTDLPSPFQQFELMICWLNHSSLTSGKRFIIRHHSTEVKGILQSFNYRLNVTDQRRETVTENASMNDLVSVMIKSSGPLFLESYRKNKIMGSVILIDEITGETLAAGIFL